ncbi:MAG: M14 family metallopeptidase [Xanthomonadales bacterium]|nr:M14 family metallopeptidase [Xanthomonadales bacterium]
MRKILILLCGVLVSATLSAQKLTPTYQQLLSYPHDLKPAESYDDSISTIETLLGFPVGQRMAHPDEIYRSFQTWAEESDRAKLFEYARSHEDRPLIYLVITSPDNHARMEAIEENLRRLGDPRGVGSEALDEALAETPPIAWMAYSIHGNETSGADAALAVAYHLLAAEDPSVAQMLDEIVVMIDPYMNPDGRNRTAHQTQQARGKVPNLDDQSLFHEGYWPYGRTNHYFFDLNRDFIYGIHPETRGRVRAINRWRPMLIVDAHEQGSQENYLFGPPREPVNRHVPERQKRWSEVFSSDQAAAFDAYEWPFYTGEWFENLYPGYSSYAEFRGAVHILYEQPNIIEDGVMRPEGRVETYTEAVHHQFTSSLANLESLRKYGRKMLAEFVEDRQRVLSSSGPYSDRTFAVLPTANHSRMAALIDMLELQDIEVYQATDEISVRGALNQLGQTERRTLPAGTVLIPNRQPEGRLLATMLEFDAEILPEVIREERERILRNESSLMYDTTAWNLTMMLGLPALTLDGDLPTDVKRYERPTVEEAAGAGEAIAHAVDGRDDASVAFAARLMHQGVEVRIVDKDTRLGEAELKRGAVIISNIDNRHFAGDLNATIRSTAEELELTVMPVRKGQGEGDLPDIGGEHFRLLERPRIAMLSRGLHSPYDVGSMWHALDHRLRVPVSLLDANLAVGADLRRYNVLILPSRWLGELPESLAGEIETWVEQGGTLIAVGSAAGDLAEEKSKLSTVRRLPDVLGELERYQTGLYREWWAAAGQVPGAEDLWANTVPEVSYPWDNGRDEEPKLPDENALKRRDEWQSLFMPQGAFVAGRVDQHHWLTFGVEPVLPTLVADIPVLMAAPPIETAVRLGVLGDGDGSAARYVGWARLPEGRTLHLRMSGLVWPEATHRLANAAWLTRERSGKGQVILFASSPTFRGATLGMQRLFFNAVIYGPGLGTSALIEL